MPNVINIEHNDENDDMRAYLRFEAQRRGIGINKVREEEMACQKRAREEAFSFEELKALAKASKPNQRILEGDEERPF